MAREIINVGTVANDGTGDTLRAAMGKCNGNFSELYPRVVSGSIVSGVVTVNLANASDVLVNLTLSANVDDVVYQNIPTVCRVQWRITQSGGPWLFPATAFPDGTTVDGLYYLYTDSTVTRLFWETANGGTTSFLQANAPVEGSMISPAAETVLDDLTVADMVNTLGGASSTGSGGLVRANGPALVTPALGTPASGTLTNCTGLPVAGVAASTSSAIGVGTIELGHATDTTLARIAAGRVSIEGDEIATLAGTQTLTNKNIGEATLLGTLNGGSQEIGRFRNRVTTSVSGSLSTGNHSGCILKTSGNITIPTTTGFSAVIIAGGAHTVTFNSTVSAAMATGDVMTVLVESSTIIHAVLTAAANKVTFS